MPQKLSQFNCMTQGSAISSPQLSRAQPKDSMLYIYIHKNSKRTTTIVRNQEVVNTVMDHYKLMARFLFRIVQDYTK